MVQPVVIMTRHRASIRAGPMPLQVLRVLTVVLAAGLCTFGAVRVDAEVSAPPRYALTAWAAEKGLPPGDVFAIAQDVDGYLWLGTPTGLLRFDGSRFTPWRASYPENALPNGPVHAIVGSADGSLGVGFGGGGGVVRIHQGTVFQ